MYSGCFLSIHSRKGPLKKKGYFDLPHFIEFVQKRKNSRCIKVLQLFFGIVDREER
jgi:hypothetical protein